MTFDLAQGADEVAFLECDASLQRDFAYQQPGLLRRTVARGEGRSWIVIDLWSSDGAARAEVAHRVPVSCTARSSATTNPAATSMRRS